MPRGVINYGHGPKNDGTYDPGAVGPDGYQEAAETCIIGTKIAQKLQNNGWDILAIQDGDLKDITDQANSFKPDAFLSIHANSAAPEAHGIETYALAPGGVGEKIAREIQKELVLATGLTDRGVKFANYWVLGKTIGYPAVLTEIAFISNPVEEALMHKDSWNETVAEAICKGFSRALGVAYGETKKDGVGKVLDVAVLLYTKEDYWSGADVAVKNGDCAIFIRPDDHSVPKEAMSAQKLIVVGGPTTGHPNEILLSGKTKYDTAQAVGKYLG
ncbi:N-acetylmuramoyl-L-alanine amidase LytC precursor [Desulfosporosinus acididurans]|uniref:N-acetylmuramoyl-L-alanine amidase LytC n=1 Tax=Desulfosporosinus acididurans TaxID=476652 RepID=A0A0J1FUV4_9FIRM|nr:N-acetylmuramoyl-L-alanine amidase [Desulfosporosinus acididurans]KLU66778.1 N-acetylmuramoyl-L-alanine amidase LytC precursor [Desulfosporosinus acididurans]